VLARARSARVSDLAELSDRQVSGVMIDQRHDGNACPLRPVAPSDRDSGRPSLHQRAVPHHRTIRDNPETQCDRQKAISW
jgi:hypothetical protein